LLLSLGLLAFTIFLFVIHDLLHMEPSIAALTGAMLLVAISRVSIVEMLEHEVEWPTLVFFMALFIVIAGAEATGLIQVVAEWVAQVSQGSLVAAILMVIWVSALASAAIDNHHDRRLGQCGHRGLGRKSRLSHLLPVLHEGLHGAHAHHRGPGFGLSAFVLLTFPVKRRRKERIARSFPLVPKNIRPPGPHFLIFPAGNFS